MKASGRVSCIIGRVRSEIEVVQCPEIVRAIRNSGVMKQSWLLYLKLFRSMKLRRLNIVRRKAYTPSRYSAGGQLVYQECLARNPPASH